MQKANRKSHKWVPKNKSLRNAEFIEQQRIEEEHVASLSGAELDLYLAGLGESSHGENSEKSTTPSNSPSSTDDGEKEKEKETNQGAGSSAAPNTPTPAAGGTGPAINAPAAPAVPTTGNPNVTVGGGTTGAPAPPKGSSNPEDEEELQDAAKIRERRFARHKKSSNVARVPSLVTNFKFKTNPDFDYLGLYLFGIFMVVYTFIYVKAGLSVDFGAAADLIELGLGFVSLPTRVCCFVLSLVFYPLIGDMVGHYFTLVAIATVSSLAAASLISRMYLKKRHYPILDAYLRAIISGKSKEEACKTVHEYTFIGASDQYDEEILDVRPDSNARGTVKHDHPDYGYWKYKCTTANGCIWIQQLHISAEVLVQVISNPRIMHLRGNEETAREQIKMAVSTIETVNFDADQSLLESRAHSAEVEAICMGFWRHQQRKYAKLPF